MKAIIFLVATLIIGFIILGRTSISLNPFYVKIERPYFAAGYLLLVVAVSIAAQLIYHQGQIVGRKKGIDQCIEVMEEIKEKNKQK